MRLGMLRSFLKDMCGKLGVKFTENLRNQFIFRSRKIPSGKCWQKQERIRLISNTKNSFFSMNCENELGRRPFTTYWGWLLINPTQFYVHSFCFFSLIVI
jgi:hypothetical protein